MSKKKLAKNFDFSSNNQESKIIIDNKVNNETSFFVVGGYSQTFGNNISKDISIIEDISQERI